MMPSAFVACTPVKQGQAFLTLYKEFIFCFDEGADNELLSRVEKRQVRLKVMLQNHLGSLKPLIA